MPNCTCGHSHKKHTEHICSDLRRGCTECDCVAFFPVDKDKPCSCGHNLSDHDAFGCVNCECDIKV